MDFNKELRSFRISHIFAVAGSLFFLINASFIVPENLNFPAIDLMSPLSIMAIILLLLAVFIAPFAAVKLISSLDKNSSLEEKFKRYRNATVLKWAIITAPIWFLLY